MEQAGLSRTWRALAWAAALGWVAHLALVPLVETDLFFHLKIGQLIVERRAIPFRNLFSFTYPEHVDLDLSWAFQVLVAGLYRAGGFAAIVLAKAALILAAAALVGRAAVRAGASHLAAALAVAIAAIAAEPRMVERPHLVTFVGLGAWHVIVAEYQRGRTRALAWMVPLTLVWANFHAGVFLAPLALALYGAGALVDGKRDWRPFAAALAAAACTLATPAGTTLPSYLVWHTGLNGTRSLDEFRRADLWNDPWFFAQLAGCAVIALARFRAVGARRVLPLAVVGLLAWRSVRFVAEWSLLAAPLVALGLDALGGALARLSRRPDRAARLAVAVLALALGGEAVRERRGQPFSVGLAPDVVPFAAIDFVTRGGLRDRMYVDLDVGCYLAWEGWPRYAVFQDARLPAYPDEFHRALDETPLDPPAFDALLRRYGVDAALLSTPDVNMRAGSFDPEEWALVWRTEDAVVFARRGPRHDRVIAEREIPLRLRFRFDGGTRVEAISRPPSRSPVAPCEWQRRLAAALDGEGASDRALDARAAALDGKCLSPAEEADTRYRLGARLQLAGRLRDAAAEYDRALVLRPDDARVLANRGFARLREDPTAARADLERALALDPRRADVRAALAGR